MIILGVDSGGTKTKSIMVDSEYNLLGVGIGGPGNYHRVGVKQARKNVVDSIENALSKAEVNYQDIKYGGFGMGGLNTKADYEIISGFLDDLSYVDEKYIVNDVVISHYAVTAGKPGVTIVAGTGSIAYGINQEGKDHRSGGWGWLIGDEGSGFYVARRGLQEVTKAHDGRGEPTKLLGLAKEHFGLKEVDELIPKVYGEQERPPEISSFAECVTEAASQGDKVALKIIEEACEELSDAVLAVKQELQIEGPVKIGSVGGFALSDIVSTKFKEKIKDKITDVEFMKPVDNPVVGAIALVSERIGKEITIKDLQRLDSEIRGELAHPNTNG